MIPAPTESGPRVGTRVQDIAYHLPGKAVSNDDLELERPDWPMTRVAARTGVFARHIATQGETSFDLGLNASRRLLERNPKLREKIDGIIFVTQTPDFVMPPNSCLLHDALGLSDDVLAFDTNLACSGFVYALAIAQGLIQSGVCTNILLVTADTYSRFINAGDRATRCLFGDAGAATWVTSGPEGLIDVICQTSGAGYESFYIPGGGMRNPPGEAGWPEAVDANGNQRREDQIHMNGFGVLNFARAKVPGQVLRLLNRNQLTISDIDQVVFHQASRLALDALAQSLDLPRGKMFENLGSIGNTVSASIPICLAQAREQDRIARGDLVLISGFGVGLSWASALLRM